jgi:hypothetical protein
LRRSGGDERRKTREFWSKKFDECFEGLSSGTYQITGKVQ